MTTLDATTLDIDYEAEADRIAAKLREVTARQLHRRGLVVAASTVRSAPRSQCARWGPSASLP